VPTKTGVHWLSITCGYAMYKKVNPAVKATADAKYKKWRF